MHQHSTTSHMINAQLPSPEYTADSDSDLELVTKLEQRRKQLDEEVAQFAATKDREFKRFEKELRLHKRQDSRSDRESGQPHHFTRTSPSTTPTKSALTLLAGSRAHSSTNGHSSKPRTEVSDNAKDSSRSKTTPTLSLEKLNISGENAPLHNLHAPPTPISSNHPVPTSDAGLSSKPAEQYTSQSHLPILNSSTHHDANARLDPSDTFAGLFVPSYLPLLEANPNPPYNPPRSPPGTTPPRPVSSNKPGSPASPMNVPAESALPVAGTPKMPSSLPSQASFSSSLHAPTTKRAYTAPLSVHSLPSALRTTRGSSGSGRKRKRVTFQLADRAIVEPSSSYEEGPSSTLESDGDSDSSSSFGHQPDGSFGSKLQRFPGKSSSTQHRSQESATSGEEQIGMGMGDLLLGSFGEPDHETKPVRNRKEYVSVEKEQDLSGTSPEQADGYFSPRETHGSEEMANSSPLGPPKNSDQTESRDSFTRVNEDRYLKQRRENLRTRSRSRSPVTSPPSRAVTSTANSTRNSKDLSVMPHGEHGVGFFELDEELASPDLDRPEPFGVEEVEDISINGVASRDSSPGRGKDFGARGFAAGSVPINILRPTVPSVSNSWVGTFGH